MRWPFRRHRGSQVGNLSPVVNITVTDPDANPAQIARAFAARLAGRSVPEPLTARQVITASLSRDQDLANEPEHVMTLVDDILLDLDAHGLEIVVKDEGHA